MARASTPSLESLGTIDRLTATVLGHLLVNVPTNGDRELITTRLVVELSYHAVYPCCTTGTPSNLHTHITEYTFTSTQYSMLLSIGEIDSLVRTPIL